MKLKKLFLIIFSLCLALSLACGLAACGDKNDDEGIPVASIGLNKSALELEVDGTYKITATVLPSNATGVTVSWSSDNTSVATVEGGLVTGKSAGSATITAKAGGKSATCAVTVKAKDTAIVPVTSVTLNKGNYTLELGATYSLVATVLPANATNREVSWTSSAPNCVSVSDKGLIEAKTVGSATITATAGGKSATCVVTVESNIVPVMEVTLSASTLSLKAGEAQTLTVQITPSDATDKAVKWTTSNDKVATVSNGKVTAVAEGTAKITATAGGKSASCTVTVEKAAVVSVPVESVTLNRNSLELDANGNFTLTATVAPSNATDKTVSWSTSNDKVATVSNGKVTAVGEGTATITATAGGKSAECNVTVKKASVATVPVTSVTLNRNSLELEAGSDFTLTATVAPSNATDKTVSWSTSNDKVATVSNGQVTAVAEGTAKITATAGGMSATCSVTVTKAAVTIPVESVTLNKESLVLKVDETFTLTATVAPANATDTEVVWSSDDDSVATVEDGYVTANGVGTTIIYATAGGITAECEIEVIAKEGPEQPITDSIITYAHAGEECAAFEWSDTKAASAKVEYKLSTAGSYTRLDSQLIRQISSDTARADILGLKGGAKYDFKITSGDNKTATVKEVQISSYDRSGYAHFNYTDGVGAYNDDGTLKSNAVIIYVTEATKNNVNNTGKSIVEYLTNARNNKDPIVVRIIGTVGAATWKEGNVTYTKTSSNTDKDGNLKPEAIVGKDGQSLQKKDWTQAELLAAEYNELDKSKYAELKGLSSKIKWDSSKSEYDSCWNDCSLSNLSNVTIEGVGEDARIFQWGITFKTSKSIEVRNLTFEDYTEDACSFEGSSSEKSVTDPTKFSYKNIWVHHNTFEEGVNYWDVCKEQDKHDGDGSTDFKYVSFVTLSYNVYNKTHKTGLIGGANDQPTASVTFHHNFYNSCKSRLPLARQANMHMYNNYYKGTTSTDISLRAGAYALVENCYFDGCNRAIELQHDATNGDGAAKVINCVMNKNKQDSYLYDGVNSNYLYIGNERLKVVTNTNKFGTAFDTSTSLFYYDSTNKCSKVTEMLSANEVKTVIPEVAGVMKRKSNIKIDGDNEGGNEGGNEDNNDDNNDETNKVTMNVAEVKDKFTLIDNDAKQDYTDLVLVEGSISLTLKQGKVTEHTYEVDGKSFTHRIVLGKVSSSNTRYFKIETAAACTIKVYVANLGDAAREIGLFTDTEGKNFVTGTSTTEIASKGSKLVEIPVTIAGTYYLESITGDLSIYQIEIVYNS